MELKSTYSRHSKINIWYFVEKMQILQKSTDACQAPAITKDISRLHTASTHNTDHLQLHVSTDVCPTYPHTITNYFCCFI